jgi:hypothetical protein
MHGTELEELGPTPCRVLAGNIAITLNWAERGTC